MRVRDERKTALAPREGERQQGGEGGFPRWVLMVLSSGSGPRSVGTCEEGEGEGVPPPLPKVHSDYVSLLSLSEEAPPPSEEEERGTSLIQIRLESQRGEKRESESAARTDQGENEGKEERRGGGALLFLLSFSLFPSAPYTSRGWGSPLSRSRLNGDCGGNSDTV